ncbi:MAG TPA: type II toxin-antitoxin system RelB/DinJ family antitoxin [Clostridia bacterium]|nr:type II toxin-antitoxin system RelB/DinJ family antitoxin [Clostridia bacterium]
MADKTTNISIRMDANLKKRADELFADLGLNMTTAMTMFLRQVVRKQAIPFEIARDNPNAQTLAAMKDATQIVRDAKAKGYNDLDELLRDLNA